ncbi:CapA family protein [candidate division WOR-3 bacterium]|nr:CapA family protein [candidate division WOR-3 bacterium]
MFFGIYGFYPENIVSDFTLGLEPDIVSLVFVGDIMVHDEQLKGAKDAVSGEYDFSSSFDDVRNILSGADLTMGNLETTLAGEEKLFTGYPRFNSPDELAQALKETGFDLLTTANNHCLDRGEQGLVRTLEVLDSIGIYHTGTFRDSSEMDFLLISVKNIDIAFLSYTYGTNGLFLPKGSPCQVNYIDTENIKKAIHLADETGADAIVVILHYGTEYDLIPSARQKALFDSVSSFGADLVIGIHPHVVQPMNLKNSPEDMLKLFFYSLGNFISSQRTVPRDAGLILGVELKVYRSGWTFLSGVNFLPTYVQFKPENGKYDVRVIDATKAFSRIQSGDSLSFSSYDRSRIKKIAENLPCHFLSMTENLLSTYDSLTGFFKVEISY